MISFIVATALFSFINVDIGSLIYDPTTYISNLTVDKVEFLNRCKYICSMLRYEFYFTKVIEIHQVKRPLLKNILIL